VSVPRNLVVSVPDEITDLQASSVTLGAIAMQGVRRAKASLGESAAVIGLGLIGQLAFQILKANGVRVIGFDIDTARVDLATELGCDAAFVSDSVDPVSEALKFTGGAGVDFVLICASTRANTPLNQALDMCRKKGRVVIVGNVGLAIDYNKLYPKELDVLISTSYGPGRYDESYEEEGHDYPLGYVRWTENRNMEEYLRLVAEGKLNIDALIGETFTLDEAEKAFEALSGGDDRPLLVVLTYPETPDESVLRHEIVNIPDAAPKREGILNVGLIGAGNFATSVHLPNLSRMTDRYCIHTICDISPPAASEAASKFNAVKMSSSPDDVINDPEIDLVIIATRHDEHAHLATQSAKKGKAVFCEKPMGISRDEVLELIRVLKETETAYMVGFNRRFSPAATAIERELKDRNNPIVIVYTVNAGYLPRDNWTHGKVGGGRIVGEGCHMIDLCTFFTGSKLADIKAMSIRPGDHQYFPSDNVQILLSYEDGSIAHITYTSQGGVNFPKERVEIYSGGTTYLIDDFKRLVISGPKNKTIEYHGIEKGHREELIAFSDWMRAKTSSPIDLACQLETSLATFAVYEQIGF
ncbi:MAG: bi-domain-containing oxidoreductase, partial [bacterium]